MSLLNIQEMKIPEPIVYRHIITDTVSKALIIFKD